MSATRFSNLPLDKKQTASTDNFLQNSISTRQRRGKRLSVLLTLMVLFGMAPPTMGASLTRGSWSYDGSNGSVSFTVDASGNIGSISLTAVVNDDYFGRSIGFTLNASDVTVSGNSITGKGQKSINSRIFQGGSIQATIEEGFTVNGVFEAWRTDDNRILGLKSTSGGGNFRAKLAMPDLTPGRSPSWDNRVVISTLSAATNSSLRVTTTNQIYVSFACENTGDLAAGALSYGLQVDGIMVKKVTVPSLAPKSLTATVGFPLGTLSLGNHVFKVVCDPDGQVAEFDETNNEYSRTVYISPPNGPDLAPYRDPAWNSPLVMSSVTNAVASSPLICDTDEVYVTFGCVNNGDVAAGPFRLELYADGMLRTNVPMSSLGTGQHLTVRDLNVGRLNLGYHTFEVHCDSRNEVVELDESNNVFSRTNFITLKVVTAEAPRLSLKMRNTPNTVAELTVSGTSGSTCTIQVTGELSRSNIWTTLTNLTRSGSSNVWVDLQSSGRSARYYRASITSPANTTPFNPDQANLVWIPPGTFTMGSPATEQDRDSDEGPQTLVTLSKGFWMGKCEVTQKEYLAVMGKNPSFVLTQSGGDNSDHPVNSMSWADATNYCAKLTESEKSAARLPAGWVYRLPTEAEWEYACRAGTTTRFYWGDSSERALGWYWETSYELAGWDNIKVYVTHRVGVSTPNGWGLYDMSGNVSEWCSDWYGTYPGGSVTDPKGPFSGSERVYRGGQIWSQAKDCRSAKRRASGLWGALGFRVVLAPGQP